MQLPGRLKDTTLGDLLGSLYRAQATGTLELIDAQGRIHSIVVRDGNIQSIDSPFGPRLGEILGPEIEPRLRAVRLDEGSCRKRLGEVLVDQGLASHARVGGALRTQNLLRLERLFSLSDAAIRFRVPRPSAADELRPSPLGKNEYLQGRPRFRQRAQDGVAAKRSDSSGAGVAGASASHAAGAARATSSSADAPARRRAPVQRGPWQVLGLCEGASPEQVRQAFRSLAAECHPDRHPQASAVERVRLMRRFAELSGAYHSLCG